VRYPKIDSLFFVKNREKLYKFIPENSCVLIFSNKILSQNADDHLRFKQNSNFFYFSGIESPDCYLLIFSDSKKNFSEILFIKEPKEEDFLWNSNVLTKETAKNISGIKNIEYLSDFYKILNKNSLNFNCFFIDSNQLPRRTCNFFEKEILELKNSFPFHSFKTLSNFICKIRTIKSNTEIEFIEKSCDIISEAFLKTLPKMKNSKFEYEIEADIQYEITKKGCYRFSYEPIIASGENSCILHYNSNDSFLKKGEIILLDIGAEYCNYASDTTRVVCFSEKFSNEQKNVYNEVFNVLNFCDRHFILGKSIKDIAKNILQDLKKAMVNLKLIKNIEDDEYRRYFMHGIMHHIGLDVHDFCDYEISLCENMVFAIEPAIYIKEKNIGIRLENTFAIKNGKLKNLCNKMPIEISEIEIF
jgi:Xaa-Pro aminopeptidase